MIRNLKVLLLAALAVAAFGAFSASGAQAAEFHCSAAPCKFRAIPDETAGTKTAHHVFELKNSLGNTTAITCNQITGEGENATGTSTTVTLGATLAINYDTCTFVGSPTTVTTNGCKYAFTSAGGVSIAGCNAGKKIEFGPAGCVIEVGEQALTGVKYHNIGVSPTRTITVETVVPNIAATAKAGDTQVACGGWDPTKTPITGTYTTGNTIVEVTNGAGVHIDGWWA